jgi:hypothetical protein
MRKKKNSNDGRVSIEQWGVQKREYQTVFFITSFSSLTISLFIHYLWLRYLETACAREENELPPGNNNVEEESTVCTVQYIIALYY